MMMKNFILFLTLFRIISGPILFLLVVANVYIAALILFTFAALTDFFDGYLARRYDAESLLGATIDPIADKVLLLFTLFSLSLVLEDTFVSLMFAIILSREFLVSALREYGAKNNLSSSTSVTYLAKIKTSVQFISIIMYLVGLGKDIALIMFLANFLIFLAMLLSIYTALDYFTRQNNYKV